MHGTSPGEVSFPVTSFGGLVALAVPESVPEGASPRTWNVDYLVGQAKTRDGLRSIYNESTASVGPNSAGIGISASWSLPNGVVGSSEFASFSLATSPTSSASASSSSDSVAGPGLHFIPNTLNAQQFAFALSSSISVTGIEVSFTAFSNAPTLVAVQILINGVAVGTYKNFVPGSAASTITLGSATDIWGLGAVSNDQVNAESFGLQFTVSQYESFTAATAFIQDVQITLGVNTGTENTQPLETFTEQNGLRYNLVLDASGNLFAESLDVSPGTLALSRTGINPRSLAVQCEGQGVDYLAFLQPGTLGGSDMPLQWTPTSQNRITQVGPGAAPTFTPTQASDIDYPIVSITQPPVATDPTSGEPYYSFIYFLQSAGPGSNTPGQVVTIYYADSTNTPVNADLQAAYNSGYPVYIYVSITGTPTTFGPLVVQVTGIGEAQPPNQPRSFFYFTFNVASAAYTYYQGSGHSAYTATWQRTLATLTTSTPIPNATVGDQLVVTGVTPSSWNNTWTLTQTPNASEMVITGSQVTAGVATFNYAVTNGTANPAAGEQVTITNTLNAGGQLNVTNYPIATASGGSTGTFTVSGFPGTLTAPFEAENGLANTAGTIFDFDPGAGLVDTSTNPIFGNAGAGGDVVFNATGVFVDPGTYQGTIFFILPDGSYTQPAPPVVFSVPDNTTQLTVSGLLIGPPNVVGRGIAITEAGQNGVPGANFFTITTPVVFYNQGSKLTATSFLVDDNSTTSVNLFFTSPVLNSATAIDIYGYNLFNCYEIADPAWITSYDSRNVYGQPLNRIQNLLNMSFDGGYPASTGRIIPAGWTPLDAYGTLVVSPRFGNAWYIQNTTSSTIAGPIGAIVQGAYQDAYQTSILEANTGYSIRIWARNPSAIAVGSLVFSIIAGSTVIGSASIPLSSMATFYQRFIVVVLPDPGLVAIPSNAQISVAAVGLSSGADVEIDRIDLFDTDIPVLMNTEFWSYAGLPTMVDAVTGQVIYDSENQQPIQMATTLYDTHYVMKGWSGTAPGSSLYSLQASTGFEPADWNEPEVAQRSGGAVGPFAWDAGEQWFVGASRQGLYMFAGGQPGKITQELQPIWDAIDWSNAQAVASIVVDIDLSARRMLVGVPMQTPNFWLPYAPALIETATIASITVTRVSLNPAVASYAITFTQDLPEIAPGQTYAISGMTQYTLLNGLSLVPDSVSGPTATFILNRIVNSLTTSDTGQAVISPIQLTSPNVWLMLNFQGLDSGEEIKGEPQMHTTMFGTLAAIDMRRKWNIWYSATNPGTVAQVQGPNGQETRFGNGIGNSKVYALDPTMPTDDGLVIDSCYTTAGFPLLSKRQEMAQLGPGYIRTSYLTAALATGGLVNIRMLANYLYLVEPDGYIQWTIPGGYTPGLQPTKDIEGDANFPAMRNFIEFRQNDGNQGWKLSNVNLSMRKDVWNSRRGSK